MPEKPDTASSPLVLSIDLDEWYHCRWATGYEKSIWRDTATFFRDVYDSDKPRGDLAPPAEWLLAMLDEMGIKATFFILGEVARWYPELVRRIAGNGHETACHGMRHQDMSDLDRTQFENQLGDARKILEDTAQASVVGFRAPNLVVEPYLADVLGELGFEYDSSVCPSRGVRGKYAGMAASPQNPYRIGVGVQTPGDGKLWELPIPTMPGILFPACTGVATRLFTSYWSRFALWHWQRKGPVMYYFHPYEIWNDEIPDDGRTYVKLFMRNRGRVMQRRVRKILDIYKERITTARTLVQDLNKQKNQPLT